MNQTIKYITITLITIFITIGLSLFNACGRKHDTNHLDKDHHAHDHHPGDTSVIELSPEVMKQIDIKTAKVQPGAVKSTLKAMGKVLAPNDRKAVVSFAFSGRIVERHAGLGKWVKKGQPLVTLECEEVGNARSEYTRALADYELSKLDQAREERLFKKDIGAKKEYLASKAAFNTAEAALKAAEEKLQVMGISKEMAASAAKTVSPRVTVTAPIDGRVIKDNAVVGAVVEASTEMMEIMDPEELCIDAEIYEKDLSKIQMGNPVEINVPAYPEKKFNGHICYIGDVVNPDTRTITVRTHVSNKDSLLKPGMFADIRILVDQKEEALVVPKEAVLDEGKQKIVFIREGDHFHYRVVQTGTHYNGDIEIVGGLKVGEEVVIEGNYQLKSRLQQDRISHGHSH